MLSGKPDPLDHGVVPYSPGLHGLPSSPPARQPAVGNDNGNKALVNFHLNRIPFAELPPCAPVVSFTYNFNCPRCLFKDAFSLETGIVAAQDEGGVGSRDVDGVLSMQYPLNEEFSEDVCMMVPKTIPNVESGAFPCALIRWAAELFSCHYRCHREQNALPFPGSYSLWGDANLGSSHMNSKGIHNHAYNGSDESNNTTNGSSRASFSFRRSGATESDSEPLRSRVDPKYNYDGGKTGGTETMAIVPRNVCASIISEGFSGEFAFLLCRSALLLREANQISTPHAEGIAVALKHVLSVEESDLPEPISKLKAHPESVHAALSSLTDTMHLMFFILQALDLVMMRDVGNRKSPHLNLEQKPPATIGVHSEESEPSNARPSGYLALVVPLREFAHALWLHLLGMWPAEVISTGFLQWWLHHPRNNTSGLGIENSTNQNEQKPQGRAEDLSLNEQDAADLSNRIQYHVDQILSAVVYRIHSMASYETWSPVGGGKLLFQRGLISSSFHKTRRISSSDSPYDRRECEGTHTGSREGLWVHRFRRLQSRTSHPGRKQDFHSSKSPNRYDIPVQGPQPSFQFGDRSLSSNYSNSSRGDSSPYQNALLAQLLIRFLSFCLDEPSAPPQGNPHASNQPEGNRPSYLLFTLCRLGNSIPATMLTQIEQLSSLAPLSSSSATITGCGAVQASPFHLTLLSVFSETMRLAAKLAARVRGACLEMKTDLMCFIGRLLRLRDLLVLRHLKSRPEFDAELKSLEDLLAFAK